MKKISLFLIFVFSLSTFFAQLDSVIYGLGRGIVTPSNPTTGYVYLAKLNPATGVATNISSISAATGEQIPNATIDSYNKVYYFVNPNGNIVGLSLATGAVVSSQLITNSNGQYFDQMLFNCSDTTIYGLARTPNSASLTPGGTIYLARINPATGLVTNISASSVASLIEIPNATIDPYNKIYYFMQYPNLITGISLTTGAVVSTQTVTNSNAQYFSQMLYNRSDSTIYGLGRGIVTPTNPTSGYVYLAKINPLTGVATNISPASVATSFQIPNAAIDPYNKIYYFVTGSGNVMGLSLATGTVVYNQPISNTGASYFDQMLFNCNFCPSAKSSNLNTGLLDLEALSGDYNMFPNPANASVLFQSPNNQAFRLEIFSHEGQLLFKENSDSVNPLRIYTGQFKAGIYSVRITDQSGKVSFKKLCVE